MPYLSLCLAPVRAIIMRQPCACRSSPHISSVKCYTRRSWVESRGVRIRRSPADDVSVSAGLRVCLAS